MHRKTQTVRFVAMTALISFLTMLAVNFGGVTPSQAVNAPITLSLSTAPQTAYPLLGGVPFPKGALTSLSNLKVQSGGQEVPAQFDSLAKWPDGSFKSVLVQLIGAPGVSTYSLYYGTGVARGSYNTGLTVSNGSSDITVTTGPVKFRIDKAKFSVLNQVWRDKNGNKTFEDTEAVVTQPGEIFLIDAFDKAEYKSSLFGSPTYTLEEQGPVRAVIRATGKLQAADGRTLTDFIVRIYAYAGKDYLTMDYTLVDPREERNVAATRSTLALSVAGYGIRLPFAVASPVATFGGENGAVHTGSGGSSSTTTTTSSSTLAPASTLSTLTTGLIGYWKLDNNVTDTQGTYSGAQAGGTFTTSFAPVTFTNTHALTFDGVDDLVTVANAAPLNAYPVSVAAWVKTTDTNGAIFNKYLPSSFNGFQVYLNNGEVCAWYFKNNADYVWDGGSGLNGGPVNDGKWHHVAFTVDSTGGKLYVDGVVKASRAWTGAAGAPTTAQGLTFGRYPTKSFMGGTLDDIRLYNRALTGAEVSALATAGDAPSSGDGTLAYWKLDNSAASATGSHNGAVVGATFVTTAAPTTFTNSHALSFATPASVMTVPHAPALNGYPLSAAAWIKTTQTGNKSAVINKYIAGSKNGWMLYMTEDGNIRAWYFKDASNHTWDGGSGISGGPVNNGQWRHVAFTVDSAGLKLYVDGALKASRAWTGTAGPATTTQLLSVGQYPAKPSFAGLIDDARVYNKALTAAEVATLAQRSGGSEPPPPDPSPSGGSYLFQNGKFTYVDGVLKPFTFSYSGAGTGAKAAGWMEAKNSTAGISVMVRHFWEQFPKELAVEGSKAVIYLHPTRASGTSPDKSYPPLANLTYTRPNTMYFPREGGAKTYQMLVRFNGGTGDSTSATALNKDFQVRPRLICPAAWYASSKAFGNIIEGGAWTAGYDKYLMDEIYVPSVETKKATGGLAIPYGWRDFGDRMRGGHSDVWNGVKIPAFYNDTHVGARNFLIQYLRTLDNRWFDYGEIASRHWMDIDVSHANRLGYWQQGGVYKGFGPGEAHVIKHDVIDHSSRNMHFGHAHLSGLPDYYLLTGDRRALEVVNEVGTWWTKVVPAMFPVQAPNPHWAEAERDFGWPLFVMNEAYRVTGDVKYVQAAAQLVKHLISWWQTPSDHWVNGVKVGRNDWTQGTGWWYMYPRCDNSPSPPAGTILYNGTNPWMAGALIGAVIQFYEINKDHNLADNKLVLEMARQTTEYVVKYGWETSKQYKPYNYFIYSEASRQTDGGGNHLWFPLAYLGAKVKKGEIQPTSTSPQWLAIAKGIYDSWKVVKSRGTTSTGWYGYEMIHEPDFFKIMRDQETGS